MMKQMPFTVALVHFQWPVRDMVSDMLKAVGFERIQFERFDSEICIGRNVDEAIQFALEIGPTGEIIRLAGEEGLRLKGEVESALVDVIGKFERKDGTIWAPSSAWFITAYNPSSDNKE